MALLAAAAAATSLDTTFSFGDVVTGPDAARRPDSVDSVDFTEALALVDAAAGAAEKPGSESNPPLTPAEVGGVTVLATGGAQIVLVDQTVSATEVTDGAPTE